MNPKESNNIPLDMRDASFIDVHYHANPDAYRRRHSALQSARIYGDLGGWVVLKNHLGCTAAQAYEGRVAGLPVSGSVVLNEIAGGLDWRVVELSLCRTHETSGRLIVHLPTVTGRKHTSRLERAVSHPILTSRRIMPLAISDDSGALLPAVDEILRLACDNPVVISSGHANRAEVYRLIDASLRRNVPRLMLNQPANPMTGLNADDLHQISSVDTVYIEQCALTYLLGYQDRDDFGEVLRNVPRVVYSSDIGQTSQPDIREWREISQQWFREFDLTADRIDAISRRNPFSMLN